jgi:tetratricopeptide (TPR) repeat protein
MKKKIVIILLILISIIIPSGAGLLWYGKSQIREVSDKAANAFNNGRFEEALDYSKTIHKYNRKFNNIKNNSESQTALAANLTLVGNCYIALGQYKEALTYLEEASGLDIPFEMQVIIHNSMGMVYRELGNFEKTIWHFEKALTITKEQHLQEKYDVTILGNLGDAYFLSHDYEKALFYYNDTIKLAKKVKHDDSLILALRGKAVVYSALNHNSKAIGFIEDALSLARKLNNP